MEALEVHSEIKEEIRRTTERQSDKIKKERVQFDFSPSALKILDDLKDKTEAATRAETVRDALKVYEWFVRTTDAESIITVTDKEGNLLFKLPAFVLGAKWAKRETP